MNSVSRHSFCALSLALLTSFHVVHGMEEDYRLKKAQEAKALMTEFSEKMAQWAETVDADHVAAAQEQHGDFDETQRFLSLMLPVNKGLAQLKKIGVTETTTIGPVVATDIVPAVIDRNTGKLKGFCIIERVDKGVKTFATVGGFNEADLIGAQNAIKEASEEVRVRIPLITVRPAGVFDDPERDTRQRVISLAYTGATYDMPQTTREAQSVFLIKDENDIPEGPWFAIDHAEIVKACIAQYRKSESELLRALKEAVQ